MRGEKPSVRGVHRMQEALGSSGEFKEGSGMFQQQ